MLHERFSHDQHQLLIRQMLHVKQESTVKDSVDRFAELIDQLALLQFQQWHALLYHSLC